MKLLANDGHPVTRFGSCYCRFVHVRQTSNTFELRILGDEATSWMQVEAYLRNKRLPATAISSVDTGVALLCFSGASQGQHLRLLKGAALVDADGRIDVLPSLKDVEGRLAVVGRGRLRNLERVDGVLSVSAGSHVPKLVYVSNRIEIEGQPGDRVFLPRLVGIGHNLLIAPGVAVDAPELRFLGGRGPMADSLVAHPSFHENLGVDPRKTLSGRLYVDVEAEEASPYESGLMP